MPAFDISGRIQAVLDRAASLRPNILPNLQQSMAARGGGRLLGRITGQSLPTAPAAAAVWPGPKDFPSAGPLGYRQDQGAGGAPTVGDSGYRQPT